MKNVGKNRLSAIVLASVVLCSTCCLIGCHSTKGGKNQFAFPSLPKVKLKEAKPKKDNRGPLTVGEFLAEERPGF